jgi:hypothetical protein
MGVEEDQVVKEATPGKKKSKGKGVAEFERCFCEKTKEEKK